MVCNVIRACAHITCYLCRYHLALSPGDLQRLIFRPFPSQSICTCCIRNHGVLPTSECFPGLLQSTRCSPPTLGTGSNLNLLKTVLVLIAFRTNRFPQVLSHHGRNQKHNICFLQIQNIYLMCRYQILVIPT